MPNGTASAKLPISSGRMKPEHQHQPDRRRRRPTRRACPCRAPCARRYIRTHQSSTEQVRKKPAMRHQPPSLSGGIEQAVLRRRRLEREPRQLADELDRVPVHRGQHVQADDLEGDEEAQQRGDAEASRDRSARAARRRSGRAGGSAAASRVRSRGRRGRSATPAYDGAVACDRREQILVFESHLAVSSCLARL